MRKVKPHQIEQVKRQELRFGLCAIDALVILKYPADNRSSFYSERFKK